nr:hypothetical protein [Tanacetum cinerariifolium]
MLQKCHGHRLTKGAIIQIFYHRLDEPAQGILDETTGGIFLYKSLNQDFQLLEDKVLFNLDWFTKSQTEHHQKSIAFADGSNSNKDIYQLMTKLKAMDSQTISIKEEIQDMYDKYNNLRNKNASKNRMNDDTPMCKRHEVNDLDKLLTELNHDVKNDLEDFKRCVYCMSTIHDKLYDRDDRKSTTVLHNKKSKTINQEPQANLEKSLTKFLDGQRVTNVFVKNNINDIIIKMKQKEKNCQTIYKNMERKIDEWEKSQNVSSEQTSRTE